MAKGNILKEAIADAKAVREVALANAKAALEEAFTPKIQNMLSARLSEDLEEDYYEDGDDDLELGETDDVKYNENESMDEEIDLEEILNELELDESKEADNEEVVAEGDDEEDLEEVHKPHYEADEVQLVNPKAEYVAENEEFDLDVLLKEINDLEEQGNLDRTYQKPLPSRSQQGGGPKRPNIKSTRKPSRLNRVATKAQAKGAARAGLKIRQTPRLQEKANGCVDKEAHAELRETKNELTKIKSAFKTIKGELNEVNLLNSKLLYVNRIFKANHLDDAQKLRVVETLDKAESTNDAKLIYETIKNSFSIANNGKKSIKLTKKSIKESFKKGMASKAAGISRSKRAAPNKAILNESGNMVNRFQKLANIKISE